MRLAPETSFLANPSAQRVCRLIEEGGFEVYFVGGCVRNAIMGEAQSDIDMSTNARPEQVIALADAAHVKSVPTGIAHGTVTLVIDTEPFEITTFRRDVETDGRRAVVSFSDKIEDDALRRDFTMNALYARRDGTVVDPLGGLPDALDRRVVFIRDAQARIREDYLRTLRYFRFWACYAAQDEGFDPDALAAIADTLDGLGTLSAERIRVELMKLLSAPDPARAVATMKQVGIFTHILPIGDLTTFFRLLETEQRTKMPVSWLARLASLGPLDPVERLRLSKREARDLETLRDGVAATWPMRAMGAEYGAALGWDAAVLRAATFEQPISAADFDRIIEGAGQTCPITPADLMPDVQGPALGAKLKQLRDKWLASDLTLEKRDLLG